MTRFLVALLACGSLTASLSAQQAWVRETDLSNGLVYDIPLQAGGGTFSAPLPVSERGGMFELFARGTAWDNKIYLLDSKLIRAYFPAASMTLASEDSYIRGELASGRYVRRTRADRPFSITLQISGLVPGSSNRAENSVYFASHGRNFDPSSYSGLGRPQYLLHESNLGNGSSNLGPLYHELTSATLKAGCGEQVYTLLRYAADGVPDTILAQPKLEVWPVASAIIENVTAGQVFIDRIPSVIVRLQDLYPDSRTYAQIYSGQQVLGTAGTVIGGAERRFGRHYNPDSNIEPANVPQTLSITLEALSNYTPKDGFYTLEILTETPFFNRAPERLAVVTFEVDRVISSRGKLSTAEGQDP